VRFARLALTLRCECTAERTEMRRMLTICVMWSVLGLITLAQVLITPPSSSPRVTIGVKSRGVIVVPSSGGGPAPSGPLLDDPSFADLNTTGTNDMASDGWSWASAHPIVIDSFGKVITMAQRFNSSSQRHLFVVSNDGGATWVDTPRTGFFDADGEGFIERGSFVHDSVNDILHVLWIFSSVSDGVVYRRYALSRDGSNNITGVARVAGINIQLDLQSDGTMMYTHPWILWIPEGGANGTLLCGWSARNNAGTPNRNELRATMRVLSNTVADHTNANWVAPVAESTSTIGNAPTVDYSALHVNNLGAVMHSAGYRKTVGTHADDVYVAFNDGDVSGTTMRWRFLRLPWDAANNDWSNTIVGPTTLADMKLAGTDSGYGLKYQLQTKWAEDTVNDRMYVGFPLWKDNTLGDTFSFTHVDAADAVGPRVDVDSSGGAHNYAPTADIIYDAAEDVVVVGYLKSSDEFVYVKAYDVDGVEVLEETLMFDTETADIPLLYNRFDTNKLFMLTRGTTGGTPPYIGYAGTMTWR
jgi:hypothetical protein